MNSAATRIPPEIGRLVMSLPTAIREALDTGVVEKNLARILFEIEERTVETSRASRQRQHGSHDVE